MRWLAALIMGLVTASAAHADCAPWDPLAGPARREGRAVTARDLIELANFGRPDAEPVGGASPLGLSPDGRRVAFILQRADLAANGHCQALVVLDLVGRTPPRVLDRGGDFLMTTLVFRGMYIRNGFPRLNAPAWSADGQSIAYLKRIDGRTQVWRVRLDGQPATMVTHAPVDVERWAWGRDGRSLAYAVATGRADAEAAIDTEGLEGWRYDGRMVPNAGLRPQVAAPLPQAEVMIDPDSGASMTASAEDRVLLAADGEESLERRRRSLRGLIVWAERAGPSPLADWRLVGTTGSGAALHCTSSACRGHLSDLYWAPDGRSLTLIKTEGWNGRYTALYRWTPGHGQPRLVLRTDDVLEGCRGIGSSLICIRQGAVQPPRLVAIDTRTGTQRILFDPNPAFAAVRLGPVERLEWRNALGHEVYGDLVLPPDYQGGRLPVIVTQYASRGFLRGGTGNDYPIQLFARRGFAVLSIDKPAMAAADSPGLKTWRDVTHANTQGWAERRNTDSAIHAGVDLLVARGIADPGRIGITGLSDGASAVRFALINSRRFAAAAISTCCIDESSNDMIGPAWADYSAGIGYPAAAPVDHGFWQPYSLALNAGRIDTPLLMQLADFELLMGVHAYMALSAARQPVDLYAFPDEFHIKWQPRHRRAVFERGLDWFSFWLQGDEDPLPAKAAQYVRWRALRDARGRAMPGTAPTVSRAEPAGSSRP